jgi:Tfp pilus assembly protein PilZ
MEQKRRYERIDIDLPCRLFIQEKDKKGGLKFEAYTTSRNLGLGGAFVESTFLLKPNLQLTIELKLPGESLAITCRVAHVVPLDSGEFVSGMGIEFLDVDSHGRETLLRYFTPERYHVFYEAMLAEFPHLGKDLERQDVSLVLNLWEEWKIRKDGGPLATSSGYPEPPPRKSERRRS